MYIVMDEVTMYSPSLLDKSLISAGESTASAFLDTARLAKAGRSTGLSSLLGQRPFITCALFDTTAVPQTVKTLPVEI